ncbi:hypothetical protein ACJIZ3_014492 [Penstemon smallii]|uniref:HTH OST-type domain-containing protein n=1 Tax=Penstemon smallii TaxID=265156 RepID=A0ABD3RKI4_9LAMI
MKPISSRPIFTLSYFTKNSHNFSFFSTVSNYSQRLNQEESRSVRVSVWWDFENCNLPISVNVFRVSQCITNAIRANGIKGPIQITAFADVMQISRTNQEALSSTGISLTHVPSGGKNSADRSLLLDLMYWVSQNPPPAHIVLISGDRDFAGILHRLRMNNYNIFLASPDSASSALCSAATIMWQWSSLLKGENLSGKFFNQPPDGFYNSWYGLPQASIEDPFAINVNEKSIAARVPETKLKSQEKTNESSPSVNIQEVKLKANTPKVNAQKKEQKKEKVNESSPATNMDKIKVKVCEPKKGEKLKESTPKLNMQEIGKNVEFQEQQKKDEVVSPSEIKDFSVKNENQLVAKNELEKGEKLKESTPKLNMQEIQGQGKNVEFQEQQKKDEVVSPSEIKDFSEKNENRLVVKNEHTGIFRRIWMKLFGSVDTNSAEKNCHKLDEISNNIEETNVKSIQSAEIMVPALFSPSSHEALILGKMNRNPDIVITSEDSSFFNRIMSRFKIWSSPQSDDKREKNCEKVDVMKITSKQIELFSKDSFWKELESFIDTSQGSALILQSRTRKHLAQNLRRKGPSTLRFLLLNNLLHLIDMLISDKKWVEECDSKTSPFKLTRLVKKDPCNNNTPLSSNGLSNVFLNKQPNLEEALCQARNEGSSIKRKSEILNDCHKLVDHIVKNYPEGFNMGEFRRLFIDRYGYALDLQKIGCDKLANLLQIMPGAKIEDGMIFPAESFKNIQESVSSHNIDSWDELGLVYSFGHDKEETGSGFPKKGQKEITKPDNEPLHDSNLSDSDEDDSSSSSSIRSRNKFESTKRGSDSSLIQILDSWYQENDSNQKEEPVSAPSSVNPTRKQKPVKSYTFVTEQSVDSMKKSGERLSEKVLS